jgi:hypothetical protein
MRRWPFRSLQLVTLELADPGLGRGCAYALAALPPPASQQPLLGRGRVRRAMARSKSSEGLSHRSLAANVGELSFYGYSAPVSPEFRAENPGSAAGSTDPALRPARGDLSDACTLGGCPAPYMFGKGGCRPPI